MIELLITFLFWACLAVPATAFLFYPLSMKVYSMFATGIDPPEFPDELPGVALIIAAFNEETVIKKRIRNALSMDYPSHKLDIIIHTDGSTDSTDQIASEFKNQGVILVTRNENRGKTPSLNEAVQKTNAPILIFSDANSMLQPDSIRYLVRWFARENVGCVCGRLRYKENLDDIAAKGERRYWNWDTRLKLWEGRNGRLLGGNGAILALRRTLAVPLPGNQSNDMVWPIITRLEGYLNIFDPEAVAVEKTPGSIERESRRKSRIIARGMAGVFYSLKYAFQDTGKPGITSFGKAFLLYQLIAKKLFRYLAFPALLLSMVSGVFLYSHVEFILSSIFWCLLGGSVLSTYFARLYSSGVSFFPDFSYPLTMAAAAFSGVWKYVSGSELSRWKSQR